MRDRLSLYLVLIVGSVLYGWFLLSEQSAPSIQLNNLAPEFSLLDSDGQAVNVADYRGRWVLVHFWATWCGPCLQEIPSLNILQQNFPAKQFFVLGVAVETGAEQLRKFREKIPTQFKVVLDPKGDVAQSYGTNQLPESYLLNPTGIVVEKMIGAQKWDAPAWQKKIRAYLL